MAYWSNGGAIKADDTRLKQIAKCPMEEWARTKGMMLEFFREENGLWYHDRIEEELKKAKENYSKKVHQTEAARTARWPTDNVTEQVTDSLTDGQPQPQSPTPIQPEEQSPKKERDASLSLAQEVFDSWNSYGALPRCLVMSDKRRRTLAVRLNESFFAANWVAALNKVASSKFCLGESERGWKASLDWFIQPDSVAKIMEGKYDNTINPAAQKRMEIELRKYHL
jgi:uncharacterized protein YdaU (DUF1376 family)